jgi:hypothetical protein
MLNLKDVYDLDQIEFVPVAEGDAPEENSEIYIADDIFTKQMHIKHEGMFIPQHSHSYEHMSMLAHGSVRVWQDGVFTGDYVAPVGIKIPANVKHTFMSLEPDTIIYCIHNISRSGEVDVSEEHHLLEV